MPVPYPVSTNTAHRRELCHQEEVLLQSLFSTASVFSLEVSNISVPLPWQRFSYPSQPQCIFPGFLVINTSSRLSSYAIFLKIVQLRFFFNIMFNAIAVLSLSVNAPAKFLLTFPCTRVVKPQQHTGWKLGHIHDVLQSALLCQST